MAHRGLRELLSCALVVSCAGVAGALAAGGSQATAAPPTTPGTYVPVAPARLLDTRSSMGAAEPAGQGTAHLAVLNRAGVPATGVAAVALNVTVTDAQHAGNVAVFADGTARPKISNINFAAGRTVANLVISRVGIDGEVDFYNDSAGRTQYIADVEGYYLAGTPSVAGAFAAVTPTRVLDTRSKLGGTRPSGHGTVQLQVLGRGGVPASGVADVVLNLTVTQPTATGYLRAYPAGTAVPTVSNLNFVAGQTVANLADVRVGSGGKVAINNASAGTVQVIADVVGYHRSGTATAPGAFVSLAPARVMDTRTNLGSTAPAPGGIAELPVLGHGGVPATGVYAVALTVTVTQATTSGYVTAFADGSNTPTTSTLDYTKGQTVANLVLAQVSNSGDVSLHLAASGQAQLVVDVSGYFRSNNDTPSVVAPQTTTASTNALPTVQIDGVVWSQAIVGGTVYAGGSFANARPAGAAPGTDLTPRANLLAYNLSTGDLDTSFDPSLNAQVKVVAASPDGSRIYVGGSFTTADGQQRYRLAAYDTATGELDPNFHPTLDATVNALAVTNTTVYAGGGFSNANGDTRARLAAFSASDGSTLAWNPGANDIVDALQLTPDGTHVIVGGAFTQLGGASATGVGSVDATTGAPTPFAVNQVVQDSGGGAAILSLSTDGSAIYGTGYSYGAGNFEGTFSANPSTGAINWLEDCHGDTYSVFAAGTDVYTAGHAHFCGNIGGFGETTPRSYRRTLAFTSAVAGQVQPNIDFDYASFVGQPAPSLLNWYPTLTPGTVTGQDQAAWSVTGTSQYIVEGGEFPDVNGTPQQGLVRFAIGSASP